MKLPHAIPRTLFSAGMAVVAGATLVGVANAAQLTGNASSAPSAFHQGFAPGAGVFGTGIFGTVQSVNGTSLTVAGKDGMTYTVDASSAIVTMFDAGTKKMAGGSVGSIRAGDSVGVMGDVSGTVVSASRIMDGMPPRAASGRHGGRDGVTGTVIAVSGTTITLAGRDGGMFTVDAASATIASFPSADGAAPQGASIGDIAIGDTISVRGPITTASLTARGIMIGTPPHQGGGTAPSLQ